jgi:uncharacterized membrane protein
MAVAIPAYAATTAITHYFIIGLWIILTLILFSLSVVGFFYSRLSKQILYVIEERAGEGFI